MNTLDAAVKRAAKEGLRRLENHFQGDLAYYFGSIDTGQFGNFRNFVELMASSSRARRRLVFFLNTPGGSVEMAEKMVEIMRHHYDEVYFVVPSFALSAGTILCTSGDRIYMDYSSSLGPIDPQVWNGKEWVPALGYLDKVNALLAKAAAGALTNAEFLILQNQDLAVLARYEQARDLTVTLLKKWLVEFKFKDWVIHRTDPAKLGQAVTADEKKERAEQIARMLGDNKLWHSHGRMIGPGTVKNVLRLEINDYSLDSVLKPLVREYSDLLTDYIVRRGYNVFMHSREHF